VPNLPNPGGEAPVCPICEGPCTHDLERSEYVFPDRLPRATDGSADPLPEAEPRRAGKRAHRPAEDRAHHPSEDRSA